MKILDFIKQYAQIPEEIIPKLTLDYITHNLETLDLSFAQICELPEWLGYLTNLKSLDLSHTQIQALPKLFDNLSNL